MPENDPGHAPPSADRGTQLGAGTGALTWALTVVVQLTIVMKRIPRLFLTNLARAADGIMTNALRLESAVRRCGGWLVARVWHSWVVRVVRRSPGAAIGIVVIAALAAGALVSPRAELGFLGFLGLVLLFSLVIPMLVLLLGLVAARRLLRALKGPLVASIRRIRARLAAAVQRAVLGLVAAGRLVDFAMRQGGKLIARARRSALILAIPALMNSLAELGRRLGARTAALVQRALLRPLTVAGRWLGSGLRRRGALLITWVRHSAIVRALGRSPRIVLRSLAAGRWLGLALYRRGAWLTTCVRHSAIVRAVGRRPRVAVASLLVAAVVAAPIANSRIALGLLVVLLSILLPILLVALIGWVLHLTASYLIRRLEGPLAAWGRRIAERMVAARQRAAHSLHVASAKATLQATRSLHAPVTTAVSAEPSTAPADPPPPFHASVYQNEYLPRDGVEVNAIITVTAGDDAGTADGVEGRTPEAAEVILLDCSGSMAYPLAKLRAAQEATGAAIDSLREGTWFAVVRATERAELAYPPTGGLVQTSPETKQAAKHALSLMWPEGGTAMGRWLLLARELLASRPSAIAHAILLTDGRNESESADALDSALGACSGRFQCDCRGVGTDWEVSELRRISSQLLGTVDIIAEPADLEADFRSMAEAAMAKTVGGAALRVWTPRGATVQFLRQVSPTIEDLTSRAVPVDELNAEYPTGAWGDESRDYHLCVRVPVREIGEEMLAARVSVVMGRHAASQALIKAIWTDDEQLSTRINREVAHYTGQAELAGVIQEGLEARKAGDEHTATVKLGRAVQLAAATGNEGTVKLLAGVVDVEDPATGTVRLKAKVDDADEMALDTRSTKTVRVRSAPGMSARQAALAGSGVSDDPQGG